MTATREEVIREMRELADLVDEEAELTGPVEPLRPGDLEDRAARLAHRSGQHALDLPPRSSGLDRVASSSVPVRR
jgi:hypothetical protein